MDANETPPQCTVVGFGASAGGMEAFTEVLTHLPAESNLALVFIQHLDPRHQSVLAELFSRATSMLVVEIKDGMAVQPNHVYVIPPNALIAISNGVLRTSARGFGPNMPIDGFFRSLADDQGSKAIGVILSGTASDGTVGLKAIKAQGGITFCQDPASAKYDGMPRSAIAAGCVDVTLPPKALALELVPLCRHPYVALPPVGEAERPESDFSDILTILRSATGVDFSFYKNATIRRRILRRMALNRLTSRDQYLKHLRENRGEVQALFEDVLINVTGFFREPQVFDLLRTKVYPAILHDRPADDQVRVWVAGCSTGEEAYSVGISLLEYMRDNGIEFGVQIFGTDLSEAALEKARAGIYPESIASEVSAERLRKYFVKVNESYQISRSVRDLCIFARQNLTKDPPFSKLDIVTCRNVMIYLGPVLQQKLMRVFHYALRPTGFLVLGASETVGGAADLFHPLDRKQRVYSRKGGSSAIHFDVGGYDEFHLRGHDSKPKGATESFDLQRRIDQMLVSRYAPPGVVVDENLKVLHFRGRTSQYLEHIPGEANLDLSRMSRGPIAIEAKKLIQRARTRDSTVRSEPVQFTYNDATREVRLTVTPTHIPGSDSQYYLVLFEETSAGAKREKESKKTTGASRPRRLRELDQELTSTKLYLQSVIEEQEATTEELKSANEEIQSSNEELQSTNEELLTAKEELQSTNEELTTVNEEMQGRNTELSQINNDLSNLLSNVNIPIVMLGNDLRLRRFTPQAEKFFNLLPTDVGRPIGDFKPNIDVPDMEQTFLDAIHHLRICERDVQDKEGRYYSMWIRPYRTSDNKIDGAVMTLFDITEQKNLAEKRYRRLFEASGDGLMIVNPAEGVVLDANPAALAMIDERHRSINGKRLLDLGIFSSEDLQDMAARIARKDSWHHSVTLHPEDGSSTVELEVMATAYEEGDKRIVQLNLRDISSRQRSGDWLVSGSDLPTTVHRLSSPRSNLQMAQEFGGHLAAILDSVKRLEKLTGNDHGAEEYLRKIQNAGERAAGVARQLLAVAGLEEDHLETLDLSRVVSEIARVMHLTLPLGIEVKVVESGPVKVTIERFPAEQILIELVARAAEAMPRGGTLVLEALDWDIGEDFSREHPAIPTGEYGVFRVTDAPRGPARDGRLAAPTILSHSRVGGWVDGLQAAVRLAGGYLWCYSELGKGTTYCVYFPRIAAAAAVGATPALEAPTGAETEPDD